MSGVAPRPVAGNAAPGPAMSFVFLPGQPGHQHPHRPVAACIGRVGRDPCGSRSTQSRNSGLARSQRRAISMPASNPPSARPSSKNRSSTSRSAGVTGRRKARRARPDRISRAHAVPSASASLAGRHTKMRRRRETSDRYPADLPCGGKIPLEQCRGDSEHPLGVSIGSTDVTEPVAGVPAELDYGVTSHGRSHGRSERWRAMSGRSCRCSSRRIRTFSRRGAAACF